MPLYEYHCSNCDTDFELLRPMSRSSERATCPSGHRNARRLVSVFAAHTKGENGSPTALTGGGCGSCAGGACACSAT